MLRSLTRIAFFFIVVIVEIRSSPNSGIVDIEVFGEAHCIHTTTFLQLQLLPAYKLLGSRLRINYHPYGVPKYTKCAWNGTQIECSCQHGPEECDKNALQACVISYLPETDVHLEIVACIQGGGEFHETVRKCLTDQNPPLRVASDRLARCALSDAGRGLLDYHGAVQRNRAEGMFWVPWVVINGVRDSEAEQDLLQALCTHYLKPRPDVCSALDLTELL